MQLHSIPSKLASVGLLMLVAVMIGTTLVTPLWDRYASNRDLVAELESQLVRFEAISNRESLLEEELANLKKQLEGSRLMLESKSATLASASLQERVKKVVDASGGTLASTQVLVGQVSSGFQRVSVNARMTGSIDQLQSSLYGLESEPPVLVVGDLLIVTRRVAGRQRGQDNPFDEILDVKFQVTGFYDARSMQN